MVKADGIWAFHGTMIYSPLNPKFQKEVKGDFVHRFFDRDGNVCNGFSPDSDVQGYWYDGWSSYDDRRPEGPCGYRRESAGDSGDYRDCGRVAGRRKSKRLR